MAIRGCNTKAQLLIGTPSETSACPDRGAAVKIEARVTFQPYEAGGSRRHNGGAATGSQQPDLPAKSSQYGLLRLTEEDSNSTMTPRYGALMPYPKSSRHGRQAPSRILHQLQVDKSRLDRRVAKPPAEVVDRDPVYQQVTGVSVPERVIRYVTSRRYGAQLLGPRGRRLYPPVRSRHRGPDEPVILSDVAELQSAGESRVRLGVHRHDPGIAALTLPHADGGLIGVLRQVPRLKHQRLGDHESGPQLDQEQQPRPRVRSGLGQRVDLVCRQVFGELI